MEYFGGLQVLMLVIDMKDNLKMTKGYFVELPDIIH